jgi:hypothetical protein
MRIRRFHAAPLLQEFDNHLQTISLCTALYSSTRLHKSQQVTPTMRAGLAERLSPMGKLGESLDATLPKPWRAKAHGEPPAAA